MKISATRLDRIITHVGDVPIKFDVEDLNNILGILDAGHKVYTSRKAALSFADFALIVVLETFVGVEILLVIFVLFLSSHNYCLYKFESSTLYYNMLLLLGRGIQMKWQGWMSDY